MTISEKIECVREILQDEQSKLPSQKRESLKELLEELSFYLENGAILNKEKRKESFLLTAESIENYKDKIREHFDDFNLLPKETILYFSDIIKTLELRVERRVPKPFADLIKNRRIELDIRLEQFAKDINVSVGYLNRLENGVQSTPNLTILFNIARYLNLSPTSVLGTLNIPFDFYNDLEIENILESTQNVSYKNESLTNKQVETLKRKIESYVIQCIEKNHEKRIIKK